MNSADFDALFDAFAWTTFRYEARPFYAVGGDEAARVTAAREGRPRPERSVRTSPWMARIATSTVLRGKSWARVRVVDDPLTDYQQYQLESHKESQVVGEQIGIVTRSDVTDAIGLDYWLLDGGTPDAVGVRMHYAEDGSVRDRELVPAGHPDLAWMHERAQTLAALATPLNEYVAGRTDA